MPDDSSSPRQPAAVLFACNFNRVRSPMAEALLRRLAGNRIFVDSCGLKHAPDGFGDPDHGAAVDPLTVAVMAEIGCDLADYRPKTFGELQDESFDLVVSLTPEAQHRAVELARGRATEIEYWPTQDPTLTEGSRQVRLEAYRMTRDALVQRITRRFR